MEFSTANRRWRARGCLAMVCLLGLCFLESAHPQIAKADDALDEYKLAIGLYKQKRWDQAADQFRAFVKNRDKHPKIPLARLYLGLTLVQQKKYDQSRTVLRGFVKDYPKSKNRPDALYRVGECSFLLGDMKSAEKEFSQFLKTYSKSDLAEWALPYLADVQRRVGKSREAAATYGQALKLYPKSRFTEESTFGLARCYETLKQPDAAIEQYVKVASNRTGTRAADAQMAIATVYFDTGRFPLAAENYEKLIDRFPTSKELPQAELNAGFAHYQAGDFRKAIGRFDRAAKHKGQQTTAVYWKGVSWKSLGEYGSAVKSLETAFKTDEKGPLAENSLFQWADSEFRRDKYTVAAKLFLDVVRRWPQGEFADDSLHLAAEAALAEDKLDEGDRLVARFTKEYPGSALRMYNRILRGRLLMTRGGADHLQSAVTHFRSVVDNSQVSRTRLLARFHLARTLQRLNDDAGVVKAVAPLLEQIDRVGTSSEFIDALIIAGSSQLVLEKYRAADKSTSSYLELRPQGTQSKQALSTRSISRAYLGKKSESQADLTKLTAAAPSEPLVRQTTYKIAEIAYDAKDWTWSAGLYERLVRAGPKSPNHAYALSGLAWCRFEQKKFLDAAEHFSQLVKQHPHEKTLAPEAAFKRAESLENADRLTEAAQAYGEAFKRLAPTKPPQTGDEQKPPLEYAFLSGLNRARVLRALKKVEEADNAYEQLLARFPKPKNLDKRLDEWALLNYDAANYERADKIFKRLVRETPSSDLADNAWLSLAESDLLAGRIDAAQKTFNRLQADPKSDKQVQELSLHHLVGISVDRGKWKGVRDRALAFLKRFPQSKHAAHADFQVANALLNLKLYPDAQKRLLPLKTDNAVAAKDEEAWIAQIWIMLAETYFQMKKYEDVEAVIAELRTRDPQCPLLYQGDEILGRSYKNLAKFDDARAVFRRVIADKHGRRTETAAKSQFLLAETYLIQKDYKNAQTEHSKVYILYKFPEWQAWSMYEAARCDEALEQWQDATRLYAELLRKFPRSEVAAKAKQRLQLARKKSGG